MIRRCAALLLPMCVLWACVEGGTRGTGISTSVLGNVASVQSPAGSDVAGIRVSVAGTDLQDTTNADGAFLISGTFEGLVSIVFEVPEGGQAQIGLNVPAGGTLTLNNVHVDTDQGEAIPDTADVDFDGVVTAVDCAGGVMTMESLHHTPDDVDQYLIRLATSVLEDSRGNPVPCAAVRIGTQASVRGMVEPDGAFGHAVIVLQP